MSTIAERVARGAALLDEREPGWWQRIDLETLDLGAPCHCVLGQLATDLEDPTSWLVILDRFDLTWVDDSDKQLGFNALTSSDRSYANLTAAWRELIEARRSA
jgi:hypothetical protein